MQRRESYFGSQKTVYHQGKQSEEGKQRPQRSIAYWYAPRVKLSYL